MSKFIIGIDLGGTNLKIGLLNQDYKVLHKIVFSTKDFHSKSALIDKIIEVVSLLLKERRLKKNDILGIGLGLPGPINIDKGIVHFFPNIPGWKNVALRGILKRRLKIPIFIDNDANLMSLAEYKLGAAKGVVNAVCVTLGTGVGGGIIINGELYRGLSFSAGEIGHIPINEHGLRCNCGGEACLESYIGNQTVLRNAKVEFKKNISLEQLSRLAYSGNKRAIRLWHEFAGHLAAGLTGVINLLNPDCVVMGGGVANAGKILFDRVKSIVRQRAMSVQGSHVKILKAKLGNDAGIIGAAILVKESLIK